MNDTCLIFTIRIILIFNRVLLNNFYYMFELYRDPLNPSVFSVLELLTCLDPNTFNMLSLIITLGPADSTN